MFLSIHILIKKYFAQKKETWKNHRYKNRLYSNNFALHTKEIYLECTLKYVAPTRNLEQKVNDKSI